MGAQLVTANVIKWERLDPFTHDRHGFPRAGFASYSVLYLFFCRSFGPIGFDLRAGMTREPDRTLVEAGMEPILH